MSTWSRLPRVEVGWLFGGGLGLWLPIGLRELSAGLALEVVSDVAPLAVLTDDELETLDGLSISSFFSEEARHCASTRYVPN